MREQIKRQFARAVKFGWLVAGQTSGQRFGVPVAHLLAIGSRETNLDPKYLVEPGDHGNGYGLTQADKRAYPDFVASGKWRTAQGCFDFTAEKLTREFLEVTGAQGRQVTVRFRSGLKRTFTAPHLSDADAWRVIIAGYNCGWRAALYHVANGRDVDAGTTGKNYSRDVLQRVRVFQELLNSNSPTAQAGASVQPIRQPVPVSPTVTQTSPIAAIRPIAPLPKSQVQHAAQHAKNKLTLTSIVTAVTSALATLWQAHSQLISFGLGVVVGVLLAWLIRQFRERRS